MEHRFIGPGLSARCHERLGVAIDSVGHLDADPNVREAVARRQPAPQLFARSAFQQEIEALAERLLGEEWEAPGERGDLRPSPPRPSRPRRCRRPERSHTPAATKEPDAPSPTGPLPPLDLEQPGSYLRRCRKRLGLTLQELTELTRIQGLGDMRERFESLPPEPYLKGFLLAYARELGIQELEALTASDLDRLHRAGTGAREEA